MVIFNVGIQGIQAIDESTGGPRCRCAGFVRVSPNLAQALQTEFYTCNHGIGCGAFDRGHGDHNTVLNAVLNGSLRLGAPLGITAPTPKSLLNLLYPAAALNSSPLP